MTVPPTPERRRADVIRLLWLAVTLAIIYLSLYPLEDWRLRQPSAFAYLGHGLPRYYTRADLVSNVAAYFAFGLLFQLAWFRSIRTIGPVLLTTLAGLLMSLALESVQAYLPTRVPSLLDVLTNTVGAALGGIAGAVVAIALERRLGRLPPVRAQWYGQGPALGWILLITWWLGQLNPQRVLFSGGSLLAALLPSPLPGGAASAAGPLGSGNAAAGLGGPAAVLGTSDAAAAAAGPITDATNGAGTALGWLDTMPSGGMIETLAIAMTIGLVGILVMDLVRTPLARATWIGVALVVALGLRAIAAPPMTRESMLTVWLTPGAQAGLVLAAALLWLLAAFQRRTRLWLALGLVPVTMALIGFASFDPYYLATREAGRGLLDPALTPSLRSLIRALGNAWPLLLAVYCVTRLTRLRRPRPTLSL